MLDYLLLIWNLAAILSLLAMIVGKIVRKWKMRYSVICAVVIWIPQLILVICAVVIWIPQLMLVSPQ